MDVSRETKERLQIYEAVLKKWQPHINLVSDTTLDDVWERHFYDSAQLFSLLPSSQAKIVDLGSGAGFPGAVLAIMGCNRVTLIERDHRKCAFLRSLSREVGVPFTIFEDDVSVYPEKADVITSRALAPLLDLLKLSKALISPTTICLFLKGKDAQKEIDAVGSQFQMTVQKIPSITSNSGCVLELKNIVFS